MTTYKVQMMTNKDYNNYMSGRYNYKVENVEIEAETKKEAIEKVKHDFQNMVINENYVKTLEEIKKEEAEEKAKIEAAEEKRKAAEEKRRANEERKAAEKGLTIEEYKEEKRKEALKKRYMKENEKLKEEIERLQKMIEENERKIAKL